MPVGSFLEPETTKARLTPVGKARAHRANTLKLIRIKQGIILSFAPWGDRELLLSVLEGLFLHPGLGPRYRRPATGPLKTRDSRGKARDTSALGQGLPAAALSARGACGTQNDSGCPVIGVSSTGS